MRMSKMPKSIASKIVKESKSTKPVPVARGMGTRHMIQDAVNEKAFGTQLIRDAKNVWGPQRLRMVPYPYASWA